MQLLVPATAPVGATVAAAPSAIDLGPLAWVNDEIRKSIDAGVKALRRHARDAGGAPALDIGPLHMAHHHLHQAAGALRMVGHPAAARVLGAMETLAQCCIIEPQRCTEAAISKVELAGFAVMEFLQWLLAGKAVSSVALFPQYREVLEFVGHDRIHPADLWSMPWRWVDVSAPWARPALVYDPAVRSTFDREVLKVVKDGDAVAARRLHDVCLGLAHGASARHVVSFWTLAAAFFEASSLGLLAGDVYAKRAASRVLLQYATLARGGAEASEVLAQDLLFQCAQALPGAHDDAATLKAVRLAWGLADAQPVDYASPQLGLFDPLVLAQARKRVDTAKEMWSTLSGGDVSRTRLAVDSFAQLGESLQKLHPPSLPLAQALTQAVEASMHAGRAPATELAMEVATAVLYLEAAFDDLDPRDRQLAARTLQLAGRIDRARNGGHSEPLESWMEELYRRVSERQTLGTVVGELRGQLGELEKSLDQYFRRPAEQGLLRAVPAQLMQMRGVFSVLGLDQAAQTLLHMRDDVSHLLAHGAPADGGARDFESLGNNLGALGFMIDMLGYQPALAKRLFVFDPQAGELKPLMGRQTAEAEVAPQAAPAPQGEPDFGEPSGAQADAELTAWLTALAADDEPLSPIDDLSHATESWTPKIPELTPSGAGLEMEAVEFEDDDDLQAIFLAEAREVLADGRAAVEVLGANPADTAPQTVLRRAFHTLKGSARMVGLSAFGDAAWTLEQLLNTWLADQRAATPDLLSVTEAALTHFGQWAESIASGEGPAWQGAPFWQAADALRQGESFSMPAHPVEADAGVTEVEAAPAATKFPERPVGPAQEEPDNAAALPVEMSAATVAAQDNDDEISASGIDDRIKAIGPLRIGLALYNVYLNEADEWSRQLAVEVGEWALEPHTSVPDSAIGLAHSLAGSSATVGFQSLSGMARLFEAALQHLHLQGRGTAEQGAVLVAAADEVRRLLHQFAAGALNAPEPAMLQALREVATSPTPAEPAVPTHVAAAMPAAGSVAASGEIVLDDEDDALDQIDAVDAELFPIFEEEAVELLPQLGTTLRVWSQHPEEAAPRASTLRTLHTLKGSARLAGAMRLGERAHRMESEIELMGTESIERTAIERLLGRFDTLQATFDDLRRAGTTQDASAQPAPESQATSVGAAAGPVRPVLAADHDRPAEATASAVLPGNGVQAPAPASALAPLRSTSGQAIRIRTQLLDRLVAQAGEVIITRSRLEAEIGQLRGSLDDLTGNLDRLRQQLRDIELQAESQMQSRLAQAKDSQQGFDPLEFDRFTRVQELTRMMAESVNDVATVQRTLQKTVQTTEDNLAVQARQTRELQRGLLRTRMVEFEGISERLYRVVRQASKDTGKPVRLDIVGGSIEMDRGVLDRMTPAFEHLLRNCVAHGIEEPEARRQAGKEAVGLIAIELHQEGNDVAVSFRDDGAGLDVQRIAERARALGLLPDGQALSAQDAAEMIFRPGFSTARQVSELAGRGIGTDVVRAQVAALGGRIETHSTPGQGVAFKLVLPLTTAVTHIVMLRAGTASFGVPSNLVELVQRASAAEIGEAYASRSYRFAGEQLPFYWAGALLQSSAQSERPPGKTNTVIIVRSAAQRIALHVDDVLGNQEVVIKNLGPQLARLPGMAGITVLASGVVVLLYNPVALASVHGEQARRLQGIGFVASDAAVDAAAGGSQTPLTPAPQSQLVLVVDDSITVRRVTQRLLQREGYRVALAADGLQALERLQQERPAVVLSDIEMPRMDGFDLVRNIRGDASLADLPIIMITSRIAEKHRDHAGELGVNHYLGKPYSEDELLRLVRGYTRVEAPSEVAA
ncbi:MAG: hybrid sensor histidine kinase/response regulator [Variovorax sp.]|nr:hybrid sensor histidine kinase/response regulator [Variovorax sp.]